MGKIDVRQPRQSRAIEKKKRIIQAGYTLFCKKGFYHTNTNEIAKEAGVSIGIVYHYFKDKKAIFLSVMDEMSPEFDFEKIKQLNVSKDKSDLKSFLDYIITKNIHFHEISRVPHEEFQAMCHSDPDVAECMNKFNDKLLTSIVVALPSFGFSISYAHEKVDMIYHMIDQYCEAVVFKKRAIVNYDIVKRLLIETILNLLDLDISE